MAQKLKFGNGTWATKEGSTLAYNDENNNYKPLPFTTTRNSIGTRVNKEGLIEVVGNDIPRIDYTDNADGALLLENSATNFITYSEDFSDAYWNKFDSSVTSGFVSPDGSTNAFKLIEGNANTQHGLLRSNFPINVQRTLSVFVKKGENERFFISDYNKFGYTIGVIFNLTSGTIESNQNDSIYLNPKIEPYLNGWYKCSVTWTNTTGLTVPFFGNAILGTNSYQGDGVSGLYVFGAQLEEGSYASSYIPTNGSSVTRQADTANGSGNSEVFNDSQGVIFVDTAALVDDNTSKRISISDGSSNPNNLVCIDMSEYTNTIVGRIRTSNSEVAFLQSASQNQTQKNKIAVKYKVNDFALWINGFEVDTDNNGAVPIGLNDVSFDRGNGSNDFYGKTKEVAYYDEILTDLELEKLTSYRSLNELVTELNLNTL